jgi:hypothetical protein
MSAELMGKLHQLAERRRAHFTDLHQTGRWKHYYSETEFAAVMDDVAQSADHWKQIAAPAE